MMLLKYIKIALCMFWLGVCLHACVEDTGNYDYIDKDVIMPVKIGGLKDTVVNPNTLLEIKPEVEGIENEDDYKYFWYVQSETSGLRDTLAETRNLACEIQLLIGKYDLYYEVRSIQHEIYVREKVKLTVASNLGTGWYVLKDENNQTDFDFISDQEGGKRWDNVIKSTGQEPLVGMALKMNYSPSYTNEVTLPDGTVELQYNKRAFLIASGVDLRMFNADNMELFKDFAHLFYEAPASCHPQNLYASKDMYLINAGKMHTIAGNYVNSGKFGYATPGMYELHDDMLVSPYGITVFDKVSRTFYNTTVRGNSMNEFPEAQNGEMSSTNMDAELIRLLPWDENSGKGYALMRSKTKQEYYIMTLTTGRNVVYPFTNIVTVPVSANYEVFDAKVMVACAAECIYFSNDNVLKVYKNVTSVERETALKVFPEGETIVGISRLRIFDLETMSFFNKLEVLTNSTSGWKLYSFDTVGDTPEINPEPVLVHSGTGQARYMMYRAY